MKHIESSQYRKKLAQVASPSDANCEQLLAQEREISRMHTAAEVQNAVKTAMEQIAVGLAHDFQNIQEIQNQPPSPEQAKFLLSVVKGIFRRLKMSGVPL